jgi:hypothetical protein
VLWNGWEPIHHHELRDALRAAPEERCDVAILIAPPLDANF